MKVTIDKSGCIGCGLCEGTCPEVFHVADDGLAEVHTQPTPAEEAAIAEAVDGCPSNVISTEE